jgi:predicted GNAT family N-acyltransferase
MTIRLIHTNNKEYSDMANLRMKVLLEPVGIPRSYINPEKEKNDTLIGAFENEQLIGCCILTHVDDATLQLRQMAVENSLQKKGIGASIVFFAENLAKEKGYGVLMMHARDSVLGFYKKCGYHVNGEQFFEVGIGHHKMEKQLNPA